MGQEASNQVDESVRPVTLSERSIEAVARHIRDGGARKIVALTGAGISTAAGIPDFRSPGTGLYANLKRLNLPYAEAIFNIDYFRQNPRPFYVLAKELYPGQFQPTVSHAFLALLARKGLLNMLFTQNIDCLERAAGVPADRIVEAHGSFATQRCIDCGTAFPDAAMREHVHEARVPRCGQPGCGGLVKPDIVFFGESLPSRFRELARTTPRSDGTDLLLVLGTSLTVYPFADLPSRAAYGVPRVLFNREQVGDLGERPDDVLALGSCDDGVRRLAAALGWQHELDRFWRDLVGDAEAERQLRQDVLLVPPPASESSEDESQEVEGKEVEEEEEKKEKDEKEEKEKEKEEKEEKEKEKEEKEKEEKEEKEKEEKGEKEEHKTEQVIQTPTAARPTAADEVDEIADEIAAVLRLDANTGVDIDKSVAGTAAVEDAVKPDSAIDNAGT